jgi:uncharacterized protein YegP (UPF0339 family)
MATEFQVFLGRDNRYYFRFLIDDSLVLRSEGYPHRQDADIDIASVKVRADRHDCYSLLRSADGKFYFNVRAANWQVLATSVHCDTEQQRDSLVNLVEIWAPSALTRYV